MLRVGIMQTSIALGCQGYLPAPDSQGVVAAAGCQPVTESQGASFVLSDLV